MRPRWVSMPAIRRERTPSLTDERSTDFTDYTDSTHGGRLPFDVGGVAAHRRRTEIRASASKGSGAFLGGFVLLPVAVAVEIGTAMVRLVWGPHVRWSLVFVLGIWLASHGLS